MSLSSQRGNALLLALCLSAFVGVLAMEIYRRVEVTAMRSQQAQFKDETRVIVEAISAHLQNPQTCTAMLAGQRIGAGMTDGVPVTIKFVYDTTLRPLPTTMTAGSVATSGILLLGIEVFTPAISDRSTEIVETSTGNLTRYRRFRASLRMAFEPQVKSKLTPVNYRRDSLLGTDLGLPFFAWVDDRDVIHSCFGQNSAGAICNLARGFYDSRLSQDLACRQTGYMTEELDGTAQPMNLKGTCRFAGFAPLGRCPSDSFIPGIDYEFLNHDGTGRAPRTYMCTQCQ